MKVPSSLSECLTEVRHQAASRVGGFRKIGGWAAVLILLVVAFGPAARADLVLNGGFESTTNGPGQFDSLTQAIGWKSTGFALIFAAGTADTTGTPWSGGTVYLWGPGNGVNNGLPASSPNGGNFVASDADWNTAPIEQTIGGLTPGMKYTLSFYWAAAQEYPYPGATNERWDVSFGGTTYSTPTVNIPSMGFSGWMQQTFQVQAQNTTEVLSFLAAGGPMGLPPYVLLDGVSLTEALPEPTSVAWVAMAFIAVMAVIGRQRLLRRTQARVRSSD